MSNYNGLKVCTFNAKCDDLDYKCCVKDSCLRESYNEFPDSLVAAMIAIAIIPSKADVYNIQNVKNKCVVEHLLKEICRVQNVTQSLRDIATRTSDNGITEIYNAACELNDLSGLCPDARSLRDTLVKCDLYKLNYIPVEKFFMGEIAVNEKKELELISSVLSYAGITEYDAYFNDSVLTLIRKDLCLYPETKSICGVDSLALFFEFCGKRFININVNLDGLCFGREQIGRKNTAVDKIKCFLEEYKKCGEFILAGFIGDLDYDIPQLLYRGDSMIPEIKQRMTSNGIGHSPVPADFPCDINDPIYRYMEFLIESHNAEMIPYSWLLQYLRIKGYKDCCIYNYKYDDDSKCGKSCCKNPIRKDSYYENKCYNDKKDCYEKKDCYDKKDCHGKKESYGKRNLASARTYKSDSYGYKKSSYCDKPKYGCKSEYKSYKSDDCGEPSCVPKKTSCCGPTYKVCEDKCKVPLKKCDKKCDDSRCVIKCNEKYDNDDCKDSKYLVKSRYCDDLCKGCYECKYEKKYEDICADSCDGVEFCDPLSYLKRECCLYNVLDKVEDVNDRYTGYHNHFNRCLDCEFPRGVFQAWATCQDYCLPKGKGERYVDNNSELLALDHILVSNCLKNDIRCVELSDLCFQKCHKDLVTGKSPLKTSELQSITRANNTLEKTPYKPDTEQCSKPYKSDYEGVNYVPDFSGAEVKTFFSHRVYCVYIDIYDKREGCEVGCGETLHGLGLISLWNALCTYGQKCVNVDKFVHYCIDKHPYFADFFYKKIHNKFSGKDFESRYLDCFAACRDDKVLAYIEKRDCIYEKEFYDHLLCILSNSDSRDRFVLNIGFLEAVVRCSKKPDSTLTKYDIELLFRYLDICFSQSIKALIYHNGMVNLPSADSIYKFMGMTGLNPIPDISSPENAVDSLLGNLENLGNVICKLNDCIIDNCVIMELLGRYASRSLDIKKLSTNVTFLTLGNREDLIGQIFGSLTSSLVLRSGVTTEQLLDLLKKLLYGCDPKDIVRTFIECFSDPANTLANLLLIVNFDFQMAIDMAIHA